MYFKNNVYMYIPLEYVNILQNCPLKKNWLSAKWTGLTVFSQNRLNEGKLYLSLQYSFKGYVGGGKQRRSALPFFKELSMYVYSYYISKWRETYIN